MVINRTKGVSPRADIEREIKDELGMVPSFFADLPDDALADEWSLFRHFELSDTHIPKKYKQLIGLAISGATRCRYCALYHTEMARLCGATDEELQEAVHYAKHSVGWSTYLNGMQVDFEVFKGELRQVGEHLKGGAGVAAAREKPAAKART
jgi:AhpD family alkylhydroperoxidase